MVAYNRPQHLIYLSPQERQQDYTILSMFDAMYNGPITGAIFDGENPAVSDPDSEHVRHTLGNLDWLVCVDPFEQETAAFWKRPGVDPCSIRHHRLSVACAVAIEKYGSRSDSGRWAQWALEGWKFSGRSQVRHGHTCGPWPRLKALISDAPVANLSWPCLKYAGETDDALAD